MPNLYDELDPLYLAIWGPALHHGLWQRGDESPAEARRALRLELLKICQAYISCGGKVADIGCGYGVLSGELAEFFEVMACTDSEVQAREISEDARITVQQDDWMEFEIGRESLDGAVALESFSHFPDWEELMKKTATTLKKGAVMIVADWYGGEPSGWLLQRIARAACIPTWRKEDELIEAAKRNGLELVKRDDRSDEVARTWAFFFKAALLLPFRNPSLLGHLLKVAVRRPVLIIAFPLLRLAYARKQLKYSLMAFKKTEPLSSGQGIESP